MSGKDRAYWFSRSEGHYDMSRSWKNMWLNVLPLFNFLTLTWLCTLNIKLYEVINSQLVLQNMYFIWQKNKYFFVKTCLKTLSECYHTIELFFQFSTKLKDVFRWVWHFLYHKAMHLCTSIYGIILKIQSCSSLSRCMNTTSIPSNAPIFG